MKITVAGTGYVGLVTGVSLAEIGFQITCIDVDTDKILKLQAGFSPIYEPGLEELLQKNSHEQRLVFTTDFRRAYSNADVIYIAVGTPEKADGSADLSYVERVAYDIGEHITKDAIIVIKSTVPVGTNERICELLNGIVSSRNLKVSVVSNPEFLREGQALQDTFNGDRIVIGASDEESAEVIAKINEQFGLPILKTDSKTAEMIKYASNAFLATKISFINEIATLCEKVGADVEGVARGIGMDKRIGPHFLKAGIGYGGSCFPKDTKALVQLAGNVEHKFDLLEAVINVNNHQQALLVERVKEYFGSVVGKKIAVLGLSFKPNTDDVRESASLVIIRELLLSGAIVRAYDPIAIENTKRMLPFLDVEYHSTIEEAITDTDAALIVTDWEQIKQFELSKFPDVMNSAVVFDGRNCFDIEKVKQHKITYLSVGRKPVWQAVEGENSK
ncbi:UDP-glucose/GDP-mannose dehydrogenase family protein [Bacillus timonensis]|nr:UDP-glucose/GDP-mannose dehydrogenase family protein [Bacillus timonensis]